MLELQQGVWLSAAQTKALSQRINEARRQPTYPYPWEGLEERLRRAGSSKILFVGYGSMLNSGSAARTISSESLRFRQPVIALGGRRLFNYEMRSDGGRYGPPTGHLDLAALNVRLTGLIEDAINGVLVEIPLSDIPALRAREVGYDLEPVACLGWEELEKPPFLAYILQAPDEPRAGKRRTNNSLEPHREYYRVCRNGAREFGELFLQFWLSTTYLADGITPVGDWEAKEFPDV
jgi:hypothetical protein